MMCDRSKRSAAFPNPLANPGESKNERGVALLIALLLLMLISAVSLGMYISMSSDSLINGFYRNQQSAYYAADSGINIARQYLINQVQTYEPAPNAFVAGTSPLPANTAALVLASLNAKFGGGAYYPIGTGAAAGSWPAQFTVVNASTTFTLSGAPVGSLPLPSSNPPIYTAYAYTFNYTIRTVGKSQSGEQATLQESGSIGVNENPGPNNVINFAGYGAFVDNYPPCLGPLAPGLFTGPTFTNGAWGFGNFGTNYIFTDPVGQANANASYWVNWSCFQSPTTSYTNGGTTVAPVFQAGFNLGQPNIPLPQNVYNQELAAIDGKGTVCPSVGACSPGSPPSQATLSTDLRDVTGAAWPSSPPSSGVYLPYSTSASTCGSVTPPCFTGGGIFVQGNASLGLAATNDTNGNPTQTYTISQGGATTTVVVNDVTNVTTISSGASTQTINGVPKQYDPNSPGLVPEVSSYSPQGDATMLYVNGSITGLTGPYSGNNIQPAIQDGTLLTIATQGDVNITGDVTYKESPVTLSATSSIPVDTLISTNGNAGVLGIVTGGGNINLDITNDPAARCGGCTPNIEVDGSLAAMSTAPGEGGFLQSGPEINTFNNTGGQIQGNIYGANIDIENTYYDRRFSNGVLPPWFPSTSITGGGGAVTYSSSSSRQQWINLTALNSSN